MITPGNDETGSRRMFMNTYFLAICQKLRLAYKTALGAGISRYGTRKADARLAEALEQIEEQNLCWVMQVRDHSTNRSQR
jgi:hypothetical protein